MGHQNDAQQFGLMQQICTDRSQITAFCYVTKVTKRGTLYLLHILLHIWDENMVNKKRQALRFNRYLGHYRVKVEHAIGEIKCYRSVGTIWCHPRRAVTS